MSARRDLWLRPSVRCRSCGRVIDPDEHRTEIVGRGVRCPDCTYEDAFHEPVRGLRDREEDRA